MERVGQVLEERGERALVLLKRHLACEGCGRCGGILGGPDVKDEEVEVSNPIGAAKGEFVHVEIEDQKVLLLSFVIYLVPVLALVGGLLAGHEATVYYGWELDPNLVGVASGFALMFLVFLLIRSWDQLAQKEKKYQPVITSRAHPEEEVN